MRLLSWTHVSAFRLNLFRTALPPGSHRFQGGCYICFAVEIMVSSSFRNPSWSMFAGFIHRPTYHLTDDVKG